jgi:hypothetical protein
MTAQRRRHPKNKKHGGAPKGHHEQREALEVRGDPVKISK